MVSPLLCNVYLHRLDRAWDERDGVLVRFADDLVVMCWSRDQAERALECLTVLLASLGLEPKAAKTRIVHLAEKGEGFDFLGFHHRLVRARGLTGRKPVTFLARWPADKAMQRARDRLRDLTRRSRPLLPVKWIVEDMNRFLRGCSAYLRFGNSAARFCKIRNCALMRLPISGQLSRTDGGGAVHHVPCSCCLSAAGIHPVPAGRSAFFTVSPPPCRAGPRRGFPRSAHLSSDRGGRLLYPGDGGVLPAGGSLSGQHLPFLCG